MPVPDVDPFKRIVEGDFDDRIYNIDSGDCTFEAASFQAKSWREAGKYTVFKAGAFDVLTLNHVLALTQFRVLGAMAILGVSSIKTETEQQAVHDLAASDDIKLMITLGSNSSVAEGKAHNPDKGAVPKPVLDWQTRARMLAAQSIPLPGNKSRRNAVDYITRHGPDCCDVCKPNTCINDNNEIMSIYLKPNLVVITEWQQSAGKIETYKRQGLLPDTDIVVISEEANQYKDILLGGPIKTTTIINRLLS